MSFRAGNHPHGRSVMRGSRAPHRIRDPGTCHGKSADRHSAPSPATGRAMKRSTRTLLTLATLCLACGEPSLAQTPPKPARGFAAGRRRAHRRRRLRAAELARARPHLRRAALQPARAGQRGQRREARPRVVVRHRHAARAAGHADRRRRHDVHDRRVERRVRAGREDRRGDLEIRPRGPARVGPLRLLRRRQSRRRRVEGIRLRRRRWTAASSASTPAPAGGAGR